MIAELKFRVVHALKFPEHLDEIGLSPQKVPGRDLRCGLERRPTQMFHVQDLLRLDQLFIKFGQREFGWKHRMLDIEEAVITRLDLSGFSLPGLSSRLSRGK